MSRFHRFHPDWAPDDDLPTFPEPPAAKCKCGHIQADHIRYQDRVLCGVVCGCAQFRPREDNR